MKLKVEYGTVCLKLSGSEWEGQLDASQRRWSELTRLPTVLASSTGSDWRGFEFQQIEVAPEGTFDFSSNVIVLSLSCGPIKVRHGGARAPFLDLEPYPQLYLPGDYKVGAWRGVHRGFHLFVELEAVERMTHQPFRRGVFLRPSEHHPPIEHLLRALHFDVSAGLPSGPALGEAIVASMIDQITVPRPSSPSPKTCQLSLHELDHLRERIEASLDQPLTLDQLATEIGVSVRHLCRFFRGTT